MVHVPGSSLRSLPLQPARPSALLPARLGCAWVIGGLCCERLGRRWEASSALQPADPWEQDAVGLGCPRVGFRNGTADGIARRGSALGTACCQGSLFFCRAVRVWGFVFYHCVKTHVFKDQFNLDICFLYAHCCWQGFHYRIAGLVRSNLCFSVLPRLYFQLSPVLARILSAAVGDWR